MSDLSNVAIFPPAFSLFGLGLMSLHSSILELSGARDVWNVRWDVRGQAERVGRKEPTEPMVECHVGRGG